MTFPVSIERFAEWLLVGERGISSEAIVGQLTGLRFRTSDARGGDHPVDPSDFIRCEKLLRKMGPDVRHAFTAEMPYRSASWAALVGRWDGIATLLEYEVPGCFGELNSAGSAPKTYGLMQQILYPERYEIGDAS